MKHYTRRDFDKTVESRPPDWFAAVMLGIVILIIVLALMWVSGGL